MMELVVDVGNTESVVGVFPPGGLEPVHHWRYSTPVPRTADELGLLLQALLREGGVQPESILRSVVGSVVPAQTELLRRSLARMGGGEVMVLEDGAPLPIRLDVEEPRTVGADRIANTLAALVLYARDTVVVDLGTATTFDCITADGVFVGGVIAPGLQSGQEWLAGRTAKLPRVPFGSPDRVIGRRTEDCLRSGIFFASIDAMDGIVTRIREEWERPDPLVVATGGLAALVGAHSRTLHRVDPFLTLAGLVLAGRHMAGIAVT
jgi:type III pantothenate kinase